MKSKINSLTNKYILVFALCLFFVPVAVFGQTISNVTNGSVAHGGIVFQRCYTYPSPPSFKYWSTFIISGPSFGAGNTFKLELSDATGSFATPILLSSSPTFSGATGEFSFLLPASTSGTSYKLRVSSTNPVTSATSTAIPSYYMPFNQSFWLNNQNQNVNICGGGSFTLSIDQNTVTDPSPIIYPGLKYIWFKNGIQIAGQTGSSINITTSGIYKARVDYGVCSSNSAESREVTVNIVAAGSTFNITSSGGTTVCPPSATTLSTTAGYAYQWFKDDVAIAGATAYSYAANQPGVYHVVVNQGTCSSTSNSITLTVPGFTASIDVLEEPQINIIAAGELKTITITTSAGGPTYEWYKNGILLPAETTNSFTTSEPNHYKAIVNQTVGCLATKEFLFQLKEGVNPVQIPNLISPNGDGSNDTWEIPQEYINANTEVMVVSATGQIVLQTTNYDGKWPLTAIDFTAVNPVYYYIISRDGSPIKKGSITIIK